MVKGLTFPFGWFKLNRDSLDNPGKAGAAVSFEIMNMVMKLSEYARKSRPGKAGRQLVVSVVAQYWAAPDDMVYTYNGAFLAFESSKLAL